MNEEFAKQLCLKVAYGGVLSAEEKPAWDAFMETEVGQQYLSQSSEMRLTLSGIAKVDLIPEAPQDLAESFLKTYRGKIESSQLAVYFLGMLSAAFLLLGMSEGWQKGFVNHVAMLLLAGVFIAVPTLIVHLHNRRVREENDLIAFLKESHVKAKQTPNRVAGIVMFLLPSLILGAYWFWRQDFDSGLKNFTWCLTCSLLVTGISVVISRRNFRKKDPEAFDWWQDELQRMDSTQ